VETLRAERERRVLKEITETPPDFGLSRELWTRRGSYISQRSGTQACHMHHENQRDVSNRQKLCLKDKSVKQEPRTLDLAGEISGAQKGNNGSRRP